MSLTTWFLRSFETALTDERGANKGVQNQISASSSEDTLT